MPHMTTTTNAVTETVTRTATGIEYRNLASKAYKRFGIKYPARPRRGEHAFVQPRERIVLWGYKQSYRNGLVPYRHEFKIGDTAVYGGFNMTYTGTIVAIGEKTVTIQEPDGSTRRHKLSIENFSSWNDHIDLEEIARRNFDFMMHN